MPSRPSRSSSRTSRPITDSSGPRSPNTSRNATSARRSGGDLRAAVGRAFRVLLQTRLHDPLHERGGEPLVVLEADRAPAREVRVDVLPERRPDAFAGRIQAVVVLERRVPDDEPP